jgi:hypothetical protein
VEKASQLEGYIDYLKSEKIQNKVLITANLNGLEEELLTPKVVKQISDIISKFLHKANSPKKKQKFELIPEAKSLLDSRQVSSANNLTLNINNINTVRITPEQFRNISKDKNINRIIIDCITEKNIEILNDIDFSNTTLALPQVFFDKDLERVNKIINIAKSKNFDIEANSWGGIYLAIINDINFHTGLGLPILNSLSANFLNSLGAKSSTYSIETDKEKLENIYKNTQTPLAINIYANPILMISRFSIPEEHLNKEFNDRRRLLSMVPKLENDLTIFRSKEPFLLPSNKEIKAKYIIADLISSSNPMETLKSLSHKSAKNLSTFNYDRNLT